MAKKIKVLQLCNIDTVVNSLLKPLIDYLIQHNFDIQIVCSPGKYVNQLQNQGYSIKTIKIKRKISPLSNLRSIWQIYKFIKQEKFDIVHVHTPVAAILGRIAAKLAHVPIIIYTAHGFYFNEQMLFWKKWFYIQIEKFVGKYFTDMLFTQSQEDMLTAIKKKIIPKNKIIWISNGIDINKFNIFPNQEFKHSLGFSDQDKIITFIGRLIKAKGIEDLFLAMPKIIKFIPNAKLLVVGAALYSVRRKINKKLISFLIRDKICFIGWRNDIPNLLSITDLFTLPSYYPEGMPRSILEAMATGKPVVATNIRGCREEVIDGETGLLVPIKNTEALADAIIKILSNPELAKKMGQAGRKRVIEKFDEKMVLEKELKNYQQLIKDKL